MVNYVVLVGRITNDIEIAEREEGKQAYITLAIPRCYKNKDGIYETDLIDIILKNVVAENTLEYCHKGDLVGIKGSLQSICDGTNYRVVAEKVTFLSSSKNEDK